MLVHCPGCSLNYELGLSDYGEKIECSCGKKFYANIETIIKCQELSIDYTSLYDKPEDDFEKRNIPNRIEPGKVYYIIGKTNGFFCNNKILQEWIARTGGNVAGILDKSVDYAIVADERKRSGKVDYAHKAGIRLLLIRDIACMLSNSPDLPEWEWGVIAKPRGKLCLDNSVSSQKEQWEDHGLITKKKISEILPGDSAVFNFQYRYYDKTRDHSDDHAKFMRNQPLDEKTEVALAKADNELRKQADQLNWGYNIGQSPMEVVDY